MQVFPLCFLVIRKQEADHARLKLVHNTGGLGELTFSRTVKPRYNEGPRDWQNLFAVSRLSFIYFTITGVTKIVRHIDNFVI